MDSDLTLAAVCKKCLAESGLKECKLTEAQQEDCPKMLKAMENGLGNLYNYPGGKIW